MHEIIYEREEELWYREQIIDTLVMTNLINYDRKLNILSFLIIKFIIIIP